MLDQSKKNKVLSHQDNDISPESQTISDEIENNKPETTHNNRKHLSVCDNFDLIGHTQFTKLALSALDVAIKTS